MKNIHQPNRIPAMALMLALAELIFWLAVPARAAVSSPLDGFNPSSDGKVVALAVQPDGKILVGGNFSQINGAARKRIARLNTDGSLDTTFDPGTGANDQVRAVAVQADGKILVGGYFTTFNSLTHNRIARLNANGSLDATFTTSVDAYSVEALAVQADGRIVMGGFFRQINGTSCNRIARLNTNGSLDATFNPGTGFNGQVIALALQVDGKILAGGVFGSINGTSRGCIARLNANGSVDTAFNPGTGASSQVRSLAVQTDGKVLLGGDFLNVNGTSRKRVARLNADGSLDTAFNDTNANGNILAVAVQADGKVLVGGWFTSLCGTDRNRIARLNSNGSLDTTFDPGTGATGVNGEVITIAVQPDGKALVGGSFTALNGITRNRIARLRADGSLDETSGSAGANDTIEAVAIQPDGKVLVGGRFTTIDGIPRNRIARLNLDGSVDTTFDPGTGANATVYALAVQPDGKVLVGGDFTVIRGAARTRLARLNTNGSLDTTFHPGKGADDYVFSLAVQPNGKVLVSGSFTTMNGTERNSIARLNANGSLDTTFYTPPGAMYVYALALQPDGKVLIGGSFTEIGDTLCRRIARLNANGSLDTSFNTGTGANQMVYAVAVQPDGKILVGGHFTAFNGATCNRIARLNSSGSVDTAFNSGTGADNTVYSLALQSDGKILLGGSFLKINETSRNRVARLNANGGLDTTFDPGAGADNAVFALALQSDGKIFVGGFFKNISNTARSRMAWLSNPDAARQALSVAAGGTSVTWSLGGSFPQPSQVLFEDSADGNAWSTLGWGTAVPGVGYRLTGLSLPLKSGRYLRASAWATTGMSNGSASLHRSVLQYYAATIKCTLKFVAGAHGSIVGVTPQVLDSGANSSQVRAVAATGYRFVKWTKASANYSTSNPLTITNVRETMTLTAVFERPNSVEEWALYH